MKLILGSSSQNRKTVLEKAGYSFEIMSPDIDEKAIRAEDIYQTSLLVARGKAAALKTKISEPAIVIVGDQVAISNGILQEKPASDIEARTFLERYSAGHPAELVSAVIVINTKTGQQEEGVELSKVYFKPIPSEIIETYVASKQPFAHAGGFAIEHELLQPYIDRMEGSADCTQGLPLRLTAELMEKVNKQ
jgi:septum formation protein